jgi:hypothetical protein
VNAADEPTEAALPAEAVGWRVQIDVCGPPGSRDRLQAALAGCVVMDQPQARDDDEDDHGQDDIRVLLDERVETCSAAKARAQERFRRACGPGSWFSSFEAAEALFDPPVVWTVRVRVSFGEWSDGAETADRWETVTVEAATRSGAERLGVAAIRHQLDDEAPEPFRSRSIGASATR